MSSSSNNSTGHRKAKAGRATARRAAVLAVAVPVATAVLIGQGTAFAAAKPVGTATAHRAPDSADDQIAKNLDARIQDPRLAGSTLSGVVVDAGSGQEVWGRNAATTLMPVSTMKLATTTAALTVLGPDHRFTTEETISKILQVDGDPAYSWLLKPIVDGLPVAGEAGSTLGPEWDRFTTPESKCAVGKVMAKTGTLTGAIALSGFTKAEDGRWKVFSFVENNATTANSDVKHTFDGLAATVNGCWA
nr:D-alanyl-D-alanine carboxypeptidase [Catenulispora rubra]